MDAVRAGVIDSVNVTDNIAQQAGGGIHVRGSSSLLINNALVENNIASYGGGMGFSDVNTFPNVTNAVIRRNIVIGAWDKVEKIHCSVRSLPRAQYRGLRCFVRFTPPTHLSALVTPLSLDRERP